MKGYYLERIAVLEKQIAFARVGYINTKSNKL